jgi:ribonuclease HI
MAKNAATHLPSAPPPAEHPASSRSSLAPVIDINVRHIGRKPQPQTLIGATAPEGWIKKMDRPREGKVWVGYFHLYVADSFGRPVRKKKEKTLGPATMPKHEAQQKLADYIEEFTGKLIHQGDAIESFADLWKAINGLRALTEMCSVTVITDSQYLQQGMTVYLVRWRSFDWCNSRGEAIANRDLWELLASVAAQHETKWHWVRGHGSDQDQDRCDVLAKESARTVAAGGTAKDMAA